MIELKERNENKVTAFCWSAFARCWAPWAPILL